MVFSAELVLYDCHSLSLDVLQIINIQDIICAESIQDMKDV